MPILQASIKQTLFLQQLKPQEWQRIPDAMKAVQKEYDELNKIGAWKLNEPKEHRELAACAARDGKVIYFGRVFPLCHIKHSELPKDFQNWKIGPSTP